ncbi:hypothetical protein IVA80_26635 [Bradyrhizobium sp. 139]|uniref:hypothetical protein n=1 Tax=Bradyrhizobium sp. 139 TaxID=2782616 RepID=UPI001FFA8519|nr:hypothetical protein [Bradyrhizobium sp. 139]MCK1744301.1 hypothetical protein [Bradyrhizobium sp. 139]
MGLFLERLIETRAYRLLGAVAVTLACLYAAMVAVDGTRYAGMRPGLLAFVLRTLKADIVDALSVQSCKLLGFGFGDGARPTRYALLCEENGYASEAELAAAERLVRQQLVDYKSGITYNSMMTALAIGKGQPVIILPRYGVGVTRSCPVSSYRDQECTCAGKYNATERSRIPASALFSPPKPVQ